MAGRQSGTISSPARCRSTSARSSTASLSSAPSSLTTILQLLVFSAMSVLGRSCRPKRTLRACWSHSSRQTDDSGWVRCERDAGKQRPL
eukprot:UN4861